MAEDLFGSIGEMPKGESSGDSAVALAKYTEAAAANKAKLTEAELRKNEALIDEQLKLATDRLDALHQGADFDLWDIINGRYPNAVKYAKTELEKRAATQLTIDSVATFGTIPDKIVEMFIKSAETQATGAAKLEVARVLDQATGVADDISEDRNVRAQEIEEKASEMLSKWGEQKEVLDFLFKRLFTKVLNRVSGYQTRLGNVGNDLAKKSVLLDRVAASLRVRQDMVSADLLENCINGLALEAHIEEAQTELARLEANLSQATGAARGIINEQIKEQEGLIQIMIKRLVDLKGYAVKEVSLFSFLGTIRVSVAIIRADVEFTRTNLIAALGLMLGMIVDIVSALRIAKSSADVRRAENAATQAVGSATNTLQDVANAALTEIQMTMSSLEITTAATIRGIKSTHENMEKVLTMQRESNVRFGQMMTEMGNA